MKPLLNYPITFSF